MKSLGAWLCLLALVLPAVLLSTSNGNHIFAHAEEDELEDEVVDVEGEEPVGVGEDLTSEEDGLIKSSPDADVTILFTKPSVSLDTQLELPAGKVVEFLVGFSNNAGEEEVFTLETLEASFRYPMDFTFYIQNFSAIAYNKEVKPQHQATLSYSFMPSEAFAGRPFGLSINLNYRDANGNIFTEAVYNQTVSVTEVSEGLDGETIFLYIFLGAGLVLALVGGQQALATLARKRSPRSSKQQIETGTTNSNVEFEWLPKELQLKIKKSPKPQTQKPVSPPKQKKSKKDA